LTKNTKRSVRAGAAPRSLRASSSVAATPEPLSFAPGALATES